MKKYIGTKQFYIMVFSLIIPIMIQQLFVSIAGYIDSLMINDYGNDYNAYNGVNAANRLLFIYNFVFLGLASAASIFIAQFFGAGNKEKVKESIRISLLFGIILGVISLVFMIFFGNRVINFFILDPDARNYGYEYLYYMRYGIFFLVFNAILSNTLRTLKLPKTSMVIGIVGIIIDTFLSYCLIFGVLGFEEMASGGAALGTVIAKVIEFILFVFVIYLKRNEEYFRGILKLKRLDKNLVKGFINKSALLIFNELCWSLGIVLLIKYYTYHNDAWYNAYGYAHNISDLFFVIFAGLGSGIGIVIGTTLGEGNFDKAIKQFNWFKGLAIILGSLVGIIMIITSRYIVLLFKPDQEIKSLVIKLLTISSIFTAVYCYNACNFFTLRAGGDTLRAFIVDQIPTYFVCLPLAILFGINAKKYGITIIEVYLIAHSADIIKCIVGTIFINQRKWVRNLTVGYENN